MEKAVQKKVITQASITARPFFEKRGYKVIKAQQVEITLTIWICVKNITVIIF
ncbi:hypothetical protein [Clostridium cuniculi]|uniref:hypothetical protein n=1 Tax=Clostridium cuniculi TaxID=2548455 RepID=UPI003B82EB62